MESSSRNSGEMDAGSARASLDAVDASRARLAARVSAPWWYHWGMGCMLMLAFASMSLRLASWVVPMVPAVVLGLEWAIRRSTGVAFERHAATQGTRQLYGAYCAVLVLLAAVGMWLEWGLDLRFAIAAAGLVIGALTIAIGYRLDAVAREDLKASR
ncbi:hypothetical protein ACH4TX_10175 [Streptomyces sp. NPDC021098]|uniref:hypothetical protein n=1 Tax=unclassified Streptomyces TaxID=2593676 RepID=UPI0037A9D25D